MRYEWELVETEPTGPKSHSRPKNSWMTYGSCVDSVGMRVSRVPFQLLVYRLIVSTGVGSTGKTLLTSVRRRRSPLVGLDPTRLVTRLDPYAKWR